MTQTQTTALAAYGRVQDMAAFTRELGESIARSQMFGCENVQQGHVLAVACVAKGIDPLSLVERYHIIQGRLSMRSDAMLAGLQERGGKYRIIQRTADAAEIEITIDGQSHRFALTWVEAEKEAYVRNKKGGLKDNWATPRGRMQMLWARVVSDGVRTMCPVVLTGRYTPEEISDLHEGNGHVDATECEVVDAEYTVTPATATTAEQPPAQQTDKPPFDPSPAGDGYATYEQIAEIRGLFDALGVSHDQQVAALRKRGVESLRSLTVQQATEFVEKLREKAGQVVGKPVAVDGPCPPELAERIKQQLGELAQEWDPSLPKRVKSKLTEHGIDRIADMTLADAEKLKSCLDGKELAAFFERSLQKFAAHQQPEHPSPN